MIFVTVGTYRFEQLIEKVDNLCKQKIISDQVIAQIGCGQYKPKYVSEYFSYKKNIKSFFEDASIIIGHGGTGTVLEAVRLGKLFIAVCNETLADNHQLEFVEAMEKKGHIYWCQHLDSLEDIIAKSSLSELKKITTDTRDMLICDIEEFFQAR